MLIYPIQVAKVRTSILGDLITYIPYMELVSMIRRFGTVVNIFRILSARVKKQSGTTSYMAFSIVTRLLD